MPTAFLTLRTVADLPSDKFNAWLKQGHLTAFVAVNCITVTAPCTDLRSHNATSISPDADTVDGDIVSEDMSKLKFLLADRIGKAFLEICSGPLELMTKLEEEKIISELDLKPLAQLFEDINNIRLRDRVVKYGDIVSEDMSKLKFLLADRIGKAFLEICSGPLELMTKLEEEKIISELDLKPLAQLFEDINNIRLRDRVVKYEKERIARDSIPETDTISRTPLSETERLVGKRQELHSGTHSLDRETSVKNVEVGTSRELCSPAASSENKNHHQTGLDEPDGDDVVYRETPSLAKSVIQRRESQTMAQSSDKNIYIKAAEGKPEYLPGSATETQKEPSAEVPSRSTIKLRSYQLQLGATGLKDLNCIICAPTGSGKTFTAGYICKERRREAKDRNERFKACFIVCIRNLVEQQAKALKQIICDDLSVVAVDDQRTLAEYLKTYDVAVTTSQVLVNALKSGEMKIIDIDLLMMDECHHTNLRHPYNAVMAAYHETRLLSPSKKLPQIVGLTASLGVGDGDPIDHYVRICANLDCDNITHVRTGTPYMDDLLHHSPRPSKNQIVSVDPCDPTVPFVQVITGLMEYIELNELAIKRPAHRRGSQEYENWIITIRNEADSRGQNEFAGAAETLRNINCALVIHYELRSRDALSVLSEHMNDVDSRASPGIKQMYKNILSQLNDIVSSEPFHGTNAKLKCLRSMLTDLYQRNSDPRGIILTRTRVSVTKLVEFIKELPELKDKVFPEKLVGQGQKEDTMTDVQQRNVLRHFCLDKDDPGRCNLLVATDVAQEGLDMPKCNFVIRYNFVSNEIGSVQATGRARAPNSECYLIVEKGSCNEKREFQNLEKEYLMTQTLENIEEMPTSELKEAITKQQKVMLEERQREKERKLKNSSLLPPENITIHCRSCKNLLCEATDMRVNGSNYICISDEFARQVVFRGWTTKKEFRTDTHVGQISCWEINCMKSIGIKLLYKKGRRLEGYVLSKDYVMYGKRGEKESSFCSIKQWSKVPFRIEEDEL